jgi:hypothetical protein
MHAHIGMGNPKKNASVGMFVFECDRVDCDIA